MHIKINNFKLKLKFILYIIFIGFCQGVFAQASFYIDNGANKYVLSFKLVNNLIVIPVEVNGRKLSFLLDTGVSSTVILNIKTKDSLKLKNTQKIKIQGLGDGEMVEAYKSTYNQIKIGKHIFNRNHKIYLILGKGFNLSNRMGEDIHGIIGGDLFKDFIVKINYSSKRIIFYKPDKYRYRKCGNCAVLPLHFLYKKPYIFAKARLSDSLNVTTKLLIDSGGSDALWLFENSKKDLKIPKKYFEDYLGQGLNGSIYGKRSRIKGLDLGKFELKNITVSFPDTISLSKSMRHKSRQGTIGSETLKRFKLIIDYPNRKITLKKNNKYFYDDFNYNMSGIEVILNGKIIVNEKKIKNLETISNSFVSRTDKGVTINLEYNYVLSLKSSMQVTDVRKDSPADLAGIIPGDFLLEVNQKPIYTYSIQDLMTLFHEKEGMNINLLIERDGKQYTFNFKLKKIL